MFLVWTWIFLNQIKSNRDTISDNNAKSDPSIFDIDFF